MKTKNNKVIFLHGFTQEEALVAMRAVKAALQNPGSIAFSMATETNVTWKVSDLIDHVSEEHKAMTGS